jgi:hypothetical protein
MTLSAPMLGFASSKIVGEALSMSRSTKRISEPT